MKFGKLDILKLLRRIMIIIAIAIMVQFLCIFTNQAWGKAHHTNNIIQRIEFGNWLYISTVNKMNETNGSNGLLVRKIGLKNNEIGKQKARPNIVKASRANAGRNLEDDDIRDNNWLFCGVVAAPHTGIEYLLDNGDKLIGIDCAEEAPFHDENLPVTFWFILRPNGLKLFPEFQNDIGGIYGLPNSHYDPHTGLLSSTYYKSENNDCGWRKKWAWNGRAWRVISHHDMPICRGIKIENWPNLLEGNND